MLHGLNYRNIMVVPADMKNKIYQPTKPFPKYTSPPSPQPTMMTIKKKLGVKVGYSDHSLGDLVAVAATSLGASVIEKHFTLNKSFSGPDHKASLTPNEAFKMIKKIRDTEKLLGSKFKKPTSSELKNKKIARKSIVANKFITRGEVFTEKNLTTKRPGYGKSPMNWNKIIGTKSKKNYKIDEII